MSGEGKKFAAAQHGIQLRIGRAKLREVLEDGLAAHVTHLVARVLMIEPREFSDQPRAEVGREKFVDHHVAEGRGRLELAAQSFSALANVWMDEGQHSQLNIVMGPPASGIWRKLVGVEPTCDT